MPMLYEIFCDKPNVQYLHIRYTIPAPDTLCHVHLPAWRPGRYELGNFAKNIKGFRALDAAGNELAFRKTSKDIWAVETGGTETLHIEYDYYAAALNAGSTWLDAEMLYMNPVNCLMYIPQRMSETCTLVLNVPENYQVATGMKVLGRFRFEAAGFHELADSPFIASASLQHGSFELEGVRFHLWFQGEVKPEWERILSDTEKYAREQLKVMGDFPVPEYHFLYHIGTTHMYHGVEHLTSTVICLGPSYEIFGDKLYAEFAGISSHELFHAWNIKAIRPADMLPYDYSRENYSELGYVAEGVTTYYGDLFVLRSDILGQMEFFRNLNNWLTRYMHNFGRFNYSVAESSWDTWLDGYEPGVPHRKVSIYNEGALLALLADLIIRRHSRGRYSMDNVLHALYNEFGKQQRGYTRNDYKELLERFAGVSFDPYFAYFIEGTTSYMPALEEYLSDIGLKLSELPAEKYSERVFGFKTRTEAGRVLVAAIYPESPSEAAGLMLQDEIRTVNDMRVSDNLNDWLAYRGGSEAELIVNRNGRTRRIMLQAGTATWYGRWEAVKDPFATAERKEAYRSWAGQPF